MKKLTIVNRTELLKLFLLGIGITLGIIGVGTSINFITIIGLVFAIVSIIFPTNALNPYKASFFDKAAGWFRLYTTGLFWNKLKVGDVLSFSTIAYTHSEAEHIVRTMNVEVKEKGDYHIVLSYSGDNITLLGSQQADFVRELSRADFLKKLNYMQSVEEAKWNTTVIKVRL
jgi:hypothetical protein